MKYCPKCGNTIDEGINFCAKCGTPTTSSQTTPCPPLPPAVRALKELGSSPLFLTAVIAMTMSLLLSYVSSAMPSPSLTGMMYQMADELGMDYSYFVSDYGIFTRIGTAIGFAFGSIPTIIMLIGLWMIYAACSDKNGTRLSTAGINIVRSMTIFNFVIVCIVLTIFVLIMIIGTIVTAVEADEVVIAMLIFTVVVMLIAVYYIVYYTKLLKTINSARQTAATGRPVAYASRFVGVMCFFNAFFSFISIFSSIGSLMGLPLAGVHISPASVLVSVLSFLCATVQYVCFGILIFNYSARMQQIAYQMAHPATTIPTAENTSTEAPAEESTKD